MQKRQRRLLFWAAVIAFGAISYIIIMYAQGYKFDFSQNHFVRTGAVAVTVNTSAKLYVSDLLAGSTSFIGNRIGKEGLIPGNYDIRLVRDGYSAWHKTATVKEGFLTDFPKVMLLPTDEDSILSLKKEVSVSLTEVITLAKARPSPTPIASPRLKTTPSPSPIAVFSGRFELRDKILYRTDSSPEVKVADGVLGFQVAADGSRMLWYTRNEVWVMWLVNTDYQPFRAEDDMLMITRFAAPITAAAWFRDVDHIVIDLGASGYRVVETDNRSNINIIKI